MMTVSTFETSAQSVTAATGSIKGATLIAVASIMTTVVTTSMLDWDGGRTRTTSPRAASRAPSGPRPGGDRDGTSGVRDQLHLTKQELLGPGAVLPAAIRTSDDHRSAPPTRRSA